MALVPLLRDFFARPARPIQLARLVRPHLLLPVLLALAPLAASAQPPRIDADLMIDEPTDAAGRVVYQRIGRPTVGAVEQARISLKFWVLNNSVNDIAVEEIRILGEVVSNYNSPVTVLGGSALVFQNARDCDSSEAFCQNTVPLVVDGPVPDTGTLEVFFSGVEDPLSLSFPFVEHVNSQANGQGPEPYLWPGHADDLRPNEVWSGASNHSAGHQVFALDPGLKGWNGTEFSQLWDDVDATLNEHYRIYGMPIYAPADGTVCRALNDHEERPDIATPQNTTSSPSWGGFNGGGNEIFVQTDDEIYLIAHMQRGSIPQELLTPGAVVKRGQYLGKVGLSGKAPTPHTHLHVKALPIGAGNPTPPAECDEGEFRPMAFQDMKGINIAEATTFALQDVLLPVFWMTHTNHSLTHDHGLTYPSTGDFELCTDCTDNRKYIGVWRESDQIELKVKIAGWDEFVARWKELVEDSFYLAEINTFVENDRRQFLGVFRRGTVHSALWLASDLASFQSKITEFEDNGLRLVDMETYVYEDERRYLGVWVEGDDKQEFVRLPGWQAFEGYAELMEAEGMRLVDIDIEDLGFEQIYNGIFRQGTGSQELHTYSGWAALLDGWDDLGVNLDLRLVDLESFVDNGVRKYVGVWREGTDSYALGAYTGYDKFWQSSERQRFDGRRLVDIHVEPLQ